MTDHYRKKPVVIEAKQATGTPESNREIIDWTRGSATPASMGDHPERGKCLSISTLEGTHWVSPGDWIIKGVAGEFYPCKPDIFAATYEPVETTPAAQQPAAVDVLAARLVDELDGLVGESYGVSGLHLNGDVAPWDELLPGGRFERLSSLDELRAALAAQPATHPDDAAVDRFAAAMKAKLAKKRAEGRGGWDDRAQCTGEFLSALLREHVDKGDPLDVGNLAMMLHQRGERICYEKNRRVAARAVSWARPVYATEPAEGWEAGDLVDVEFYNHPEKPEGEGWRPLVFADMDNLPGENANEPGITAMEASIDAVQPEAPTTLEQAESHAHICAKLAEEHKDDVLVCVALTDAAAIIRDLMRELARDTERRWEGNRRAAQEYVEDMRDVLREAAQVCKDLDEEALAKENRLACGAECAAAIADLAARWNVPFERT